MASTTITQGTKVRQVGFAEWFTVERLEVLSGFAPELHAYLGHSKGWVPVRMLTTIAQPTGADATAGAARQPQASRPKAAVVSLPVGAEDALRAALGNLYTEPAADDSQVA